MIHYKKSSLQLASSALNTAIVSVVYSAVTMIQPCICGYHNVKIALLFCVIHNTVKSLSDEYLV